MAMARLGDERWGKATPSVRFSQPRALAEMMVFRNSPLGYTVEMIFFDLLNKYEGPSLEPRDSKLSHITLFY